MSDPKNDLELRIAAAKLDAIRDLESPQRPDNDRLAMIGTMLANTASIAGRFREFEQLAADLEERPEQADLAAAAAALRDLWGIPPLESVTRPRQVYGVLIEPVRPKAPGHNNRWQTLVHAPNVGAAIEGVGALVQQFGIDLGVPRFDKPDGGDPEYHITLIAALGKVGEVATAANEAEFCRQSAVGNKFMVFDPGYEERQV